MDDKLFTLIGRLYAQLYDSHVAIEQLKGMVTAKDQQIEQLSTRTQMNESNPKGTAHISPPV